MIIENEIPILEYDTNSKEVISPDHDCPDLKLPEKCLFTFLGDVVHDYAQRNHAEVVEEMINVSHTTKFYVLHEEKEDICLVQSQIGAPAATQVMDVLVSCGCKKVIAIGSCGVLIDIPENAFLVPTKALRAEGTSYHYLPASRYIELDEDAISVIENSFTKQELPFVTCTTWTTDAFFRETKDMVKHRIAEGCTVVEMECAALAACCRKRGSKFGQFLFTADSLANVHEYDEREFGTSAHAKALLLGLDIIRNYN